MGAGACKNSKSTLPNQPKNDTKNIIIGVFGLDDAGKTSTVKVIEGEPTKNILPTMGSISTMVTNPLNEKNNKNKNQQRIKIIDVSGQRKFRQQSWSQFYDQIHGLIFVIDASEKERLNENQETLEDLLKNEKLKDKPILILANKQDLKGAISNERDLKRQLEIEKLRTKYKIELCTASPRNPKNKNDDSIRNGFSWLIRTIDDNYTSLNARITKAKNAPISRKINRSESDENDSDNKYSKDKNRSRITSEKLPSITKNTSKTYSDDDDIYSSSKNDLNTKKKVVGTTNNNNRSIKNSNDNEPKPFRSTYESFPEETPWSPSSMLKPTKSDDTLPRLYGKPPLSNDTKRRGMSPLVHDTKTYTNGSTFKRDNISDGEDDYLRQQKSKTTSRFDTSPFTTSRFAANTKKPTVNIYDDDNINTRRITTPVKKTYNDDDDDDDIYPKKSTTTTNKLNKNYDFDDNKTYPRSNYNSDYRGTLSKPGNQFKYDNDNRSSTYPKKETRSKFNDDDDDDYPTSKPKSHSKYSDDDDDDYYPSSKSKTATNSRYDKDDYKFTNRSKYDNEDRPFSSSKPISHSKFEDDDYPTSKSATRSNYNNYNSSKTTGHSKYDDDDDDDYPSTTKKNNYPSSYGNRTSGSRFDDDDDFYK